jgi:hypothetical protein
MHGRLCRIALAAVIGAGALSGCVQMTRHSNTLVFGTNTSFGIKVGADATATPGITVGYSRQEAVIMPLVANTADNGRTQAPCPQVVVDGTVSVLELPASCRLVGTDSRNHTDTYSVLASFGARFGSELESGNAALNGQIAQYFATGIAARLLAEKGGASTIALGGAAKANAEAMGTERLLGLMNTPESGVRVAADLETMKQAKAAIVAKVGAKASYRALLTAMDDEIGGTTFGAACPAIDTPAECAKHISDGGFLFRDAADWKAAAAKITSM